MKRISVILLASVSALLFSASGFAASLSGTKLRSAVLKMESCFIDGGVVRFFEDGTITVNTCNGSKSSYENPYENPYQDPYSTSYENPYENPYKSPYQNPYETSYENPYEGPYENAQGSCDISVGKWIVRGDKVFTIRQGVLKSLTIGFKSKTCSY